MKGTRRWMSFLVFSFLFILLPLGLIGGCLDFFLARRQEDLENSLIRERQRLLVRIASRENIAVEARTLFVFLHRCFVSRRVSPSDWPRVTANIQRLRGLQIDVYPFDGNGELILSPESRVRGKGTIQRLWRLFMYGDRSRIEASQKVANSLLGRSWERWSFWQNSRARVLPFRGAGGDGMLYWDVDTFSKEGGIVFVIWGIPTPEQSVRDGIRRHALPGDIDLFLQHRSGDLTVLGGGLPLTAREFVAQYCHDAHQSVVRLGARLWTTLSTTNFTYFLGFAVPRDTLEAARRLGFSVLGVLLLIGLLVCHRWIVQGRDSYLSIRIKLVFLFLYALMVPTLGLMTLSYQTFRETERGLQDDLRKLGVEALSSLDDGFLNEPERFQKVMNRFRDLFRDPANVARFHEITRQDRDRRSFWSLELRDGQGQPTHIAGPPFATDDFLRKLLRQLFCDGVKRFAPERFPGGEAEKSGMMQGYLVDSLMDNDELGITRFFELPGQVRLLTLPKIEAFFYWDYYPRPDEPSVIINGSMDLRIAKERYLKNTFNQLRQPKNVPMRLFAMDAFLDRWFPTDEGVSREMCDFARRIWLTGERQFDHFTWKGRSWIAVGIPGKQIPDYRYLALVSEDGVRETLGTLKRSIALGLLATICLTLLLGWMLSDTLLLPIGELGRGIEAIRRQETRFRLARHSKDELGDLSLAFNDMLEHLADLNAGKLVQEQLFPKLPLELGEYRVFGVSRPATHLGGDYFDYVKLDDRQFLVLIGDVTGHGIPAALIMAMSKAIVLTSTAAGETAEDMLGKLNRAIHSVMKGRRLMSMGLAWVKPFEHQIEYFHLGHTFPIIWNPSGAFSFVTGTGMPIGVPGVIRAKPISLQLAPGERLVFYTDGLVESLPAGGKTDAFNLFGTFLIDRPALPLKEACEAVIRDHPFFTTGAPQPDDFTVVMLERRPGAVATGASGSHSQHCQSGLPA